ncbi:MAG: class I SAM-dependent methyltransferase [Mariniphaga sp.]|nr:class I SAM-dependent methyltransferase [Mariniphaga sp.]
MGEKEQNRFYTSISENYSEIFPYKPMQLKFVKSEIGDLKYCTVLDIGCATGELAFQLANEGAEVIGIDLNEDLLSQAKLKIDGSDLIFQKVDMLELENDFKPNQFDSVLCFGNTLVHLPSEYLIRKMLDGVFSILKTGGTFLLQILNYNYILGEQVSELPIIETGNIRFIRKYSFEDFPMIRFKTDLLIKKSDEIISNETMLLALKSTQLKSLLLESGFSDIEMYSNFKKESFGGQHLPLVVSCTKIRN